jgi:hypothetical protein
LVGQSPVKLGIVSVAATFPASERRDQHGPEDGIRGITGIADREVARGGALVEKCAKWCGERRVLRGQDRSGEGQQAGAYSRPLAEEPRECGDR